MNKEQIRSTTAPEAIGIYSQAIKAYEAVYISGQLPLDPETMTIISTDISKQINKAFTNLSAVVNAAGGDINNIVKLTIYMTDLTFFSNVNDAMFELFDEPYPARAIIGVNALPKDALIEIDAVAIIDN
jgi:reactive intermediate/imine deaminase